KAGKLHRHVGQGFVHGHIGVAVATDTLLVPDGLGKGLTQGDADVYHGEEIVDVQVAATFDVHVDQAVPSYLIPQVHNDGNTDLEAGLAGTVQVDLHLDLGFRGVALDTCLALHHGDSPQIFHQGRALYVYPA